MWNLNFNVTKFKVMRIGRKNKEADYKMIVNEDEYTNIAKCNEGKDVGIILDKSFSFFFGCFFLIHWLFVFVLYVAWKKSFFFSEIRAFCLVLSD